MDFIKKLNFKIVDIIGILVLTIVFFTMPILFQPDSTTYLRNAENLMGYTDAYSGIRGLGLPIIFVMFEKLFGYTVRGFSVGMFCVYVMFVISTFGVLYYLKISQKLKRVGTWVCASAILLLNVVVITYAHAVLTEFFALAVVAVYTLIMLSIYNCKIKNNKQAVILKIAQSLVTVFALVFIYAIKQMFFPIILLQWATFVILNLIKKFSIKTILINFVILILMLAILFSYITVYAGFTQGENMEGDSVASFAGSFIIDGLRYFVPQNSDVNANTPVIVYADRFEEIDTFYFDFDYTLANSIEYFLTCFTKHPLRVIFGYSANYSIISGVEHTYVDELSRRAHYPVTSQFHFDLLYESSYYIDLYKTLSDESEMYPSFLEGTELSRERFSGEPVQAALITNLLYNTYYANFSIIIYTSITYFALLIAIICTVLLIYRKKKLGVISMPLVINIIFSLNIFIYIMFLALTAQNIDRYGIPIIFYCGIIVLNILASVLPFLGKKITALYKRFISTTKNKTKTGKV